MIKFLMIFVLINNLYAFNQHIVPKNLPSYPKQYTIDSQKNELREQISTCLFDYSADRDARTLKRCEELIQSALNQRIFTRTEVNKIFDEVTNMFLN